MTSFVTHGRWPLSTCAKKKKNETRRSMYIYNHNKKRTTAPVQNLVSNTI